MKQDKKFFFVIIAPPLISKHSAGVNVLYDLQIQINKIGYLSFIFEYPNYYGSIKSNNYLTNFLTYEKEKKLKSDGFRPIIIYPENISFKNPNYSACYYLNYPNLSKIIHSPNFKIAFSKNIFDTFEVSNNSHILYYPIVNSNFWKPMASPGKRTLECFYAAKYKYNYRGIVPKRFNKMIEITRDKKDSQTRDEIRDLFYKSNVFYTFEDTALCLEAIFCGCPVVFVKNKFLTKPVADYEIKKYGICYDDDPESIKFARKETIKAYLLYRNYELNHNKEIKKLCRKLISHAKVLNLEYQILSKRNSIFSFIIQFFFFFNALRYFGLKNLIYKVCKRIKYGRKLL